MNTDTIDPSRVLELLKILTSPTLQTSTEGNDSLSTFEQLLQSNLEKFNSDAKNQKFQKIQTYLENHGITPDSRTCSDIRWNFTCYCLTMLELLCLSIEYSMKIFQEEKERQDKQGRELKPSQAPPLAPDTLSVGQQKTVLTAIQFVVALGLSPYFKEGVGLQAERRSGFGGVIDWQCGENIDDTEKSLRMIRCVRVLLNCSKLECLATLIFSRHLGDILAALLQIVHGQKLIYKQSKQETTDHCSNPCFSKVGNSNDTSLEKMDENKHSEDDAENIPSSKWTPATIVDMTTKHFPMDNNQRSHAFQDIKLNRTEICTNDQNIVVMEMEANFKESTVSTPKAIDSCDIDFCEESLNDLLEKISQPLLVRELLVLQGGPGKQPVQKGDGVNRQVKPVLIKAPVWLRKVCGQLLTGILMKPQGVHHVLHGMLGNAVADASGNLIADWRKFDAVAKVIASCPKMSSSTEEYYKLVAPQVLSLLHQPNKQVAKHFLRVACSTISYMSDNSPELTERHLIRPLLNPLLICTQDIDYDLCQTQKIVVDESSLSLCIEDIHKVFVSGTEPNSNLCRYLLPVLHPLFHLYCFTKQGISHLRSACHEILVTSLKQSSQDVSLQCLQCLALDEFPQSVADWKYLHQNLMFAPGSEGGVVIVTKPVDGYNLPETVHREGMIDLLKDLQAHGLTGDFFLLLLKELGRIIRGETTADVKLPQEQNLLEADDSQNNDRKISIMNLLANLCETIGPSCLKNTHQTLDFVKVTLERAVQVIQACQDEATTVFENETLTMAMGLLTSVLTGGLQCEEEDRNHLKKMLPLLQALANNHPDEEVQEMASDLRVAIATHGVIWSERLSKSTHEKNQEDKTEKMTARNPLIEMIDSKDSVSPTNEILQNGQGKETPISSFQESLQEMCDPLLPVRGHGLISLCKLVENRDKETMDKQEVVLKIFEENLNHPDTYLYLSSARGLSLLADKFPDQVIPKLTSEFANFDKADRSSDLRIKMGECLLQTTRKLGDMAPKYRDILLPALLIGAKDKDALVRASSLSNLGEVCKVLKFSQGNVIHEIFMCCKSLLKTDDNPEVRKAAALLTTLLLQGLGRDVLKVLDYMIGDLYQLLKLTLKTEKDEKVKDHILLSLNEIDTIMRDCLFPKQTLEKKIRVLDPT